MANRLARVRVRNFRCLADVSVETGPVNVLFGPNGAGKSSFLDTIWFFRDCAIRGVELASSERSHGIGMLWDGADGTDDGGRITIELATRRAEYELTFGFSSGRIEPFVGESLRSTVRDVRFINRTAGGDRAQFYRERMEEMLPVPLREPEKLSLSRYLDFEEQADEAADMDRLLRFVHFHHSRSFWLHRIKRQGSQAGHETRLFSFGDNLFSVLRNLHDKRGVDCRFDTIMEMMRESFPSFNSLVLEQTGPSSVYGWFEERDRREPIMASGVSDGHLQMLLLLTALFSEGRDRDSLILMDEPEVSLHPWALAVLAKAIRLAAAEWNKQVFVATHSPVLISQFEPEQILAAEVREGATRLRRVSEMEDVKDLLEEYATGSLYMAELIAPQGPPQDDQEKLFEP